MSLKSFICATSLVSVVTISLYGVGCGSSSKGGNPEGGTGGTAGSGGSGGSGGMGGTGGTGGSGGKGGSGGSGGFPIDAPMDTGPTCAPGSLTGFTPAINPTPTGKCTQKQVTNFVNSCLGGNPDASSTACNDEITGPDMGCVFGCLVTNWTASSSMTSYTTTPWGGLIVADGFQFFDVGGLLVAADSSAATKTCATDLESGLECVLQACTASCPVTLPKSGSCSADPTCNAEAMALQNCLGTAQPSMGSGECSKYNTAANTDCASVFSMETGPIATALTALTAIESSTCQSASPPAMCAQAWETYLDLICTGSIPGGG